MATIDLVTAANGSVPRNVLKPHNCHEAVMGWLLMGKYPTLRNVDPLSHGVEKAWLTLRSLAEKYGSGSPKQLTGEWMGRNIYNRGFIRIKPLAPPHPPFTAAIFLVGDVLFMGNPRAPHHSMVIVKKTGNQVFARGFNNAGAFGGPFMGWDPVLRDIADITRWDGDGNFMAINGPCQVHTVTYNSISRRIPDNMIF